MEDQEGEPNNLEPVDKLLALLHKLSHLDMASLDAMLEAFEASNWTEE